MQTISRMLNFNGKFYFIFLLMTVLVITWGCALNGAKISKGGGRNDRLLVTRTDYDVSRNLAPPMISGRGFWNMLNYYSPETSQGKAMVKYILPEPMVRDAVMHYRVCLTNDTNRLFVSADNLQSIKPDPKKPFTVGCRGTRPQFLCMDDFKTDKKGYLAWKENNPNFLGFDAGSEWDNDYVTRFRRGVSNSVEDLRKAGGSETAVNRMRDIIQEAVKDRDRALTGLHESYLALRNYHFDDPDKMIFLRAGWCLDHYAAEWGAGLLVLETTMTGPYRHQVSMFYIRGAAHQYVKPWQWYIATCFQGFEEDGTPCKSTYTCPYYTSSKKSLSNLEGSDTLGQGYGPSVSLDRNDMYLGYLAGASIVQHETWPYAYCQYQGGTNAAVWELSPHGTAMKEWYTFTQRHPDRGISYAPVALLLPFNHGQAHWGGSPWSFFPVERPDTMIDAFMYTLVPWSQNLPKGVEGYLANSEYGDIYDVILPNPPSGPVPLKTLMNYRAAIMLSKFEIDPSLARRLMKYVKLGGTLVINIKQVNENLPASFLGVERTGKIVATEGVVKSLASGETVILPEPYDYEQIALKGAGPFLTDGQGGILASVNKYGRGRVVLITADYMVPRKSLSNGGVEWGLDQLKKGKKLPLVELLMRQIVREVLPIEVKGDIEYGLNKVADGWWVYLINNKGVIKFARTAEKLDPAATAKIEVDMRSLPVVGVRELCEEKDIAWDKSKNSFSINVGPGDIRIVGIKTR